MGVSFETFQDVLKHPIRRKIVLALNRGQNLSYMDLMGAVQAANTGKFNYHLKILADLIEKDESGRYLLTEKGRLAAQFLETFKEKKEEASPLRGFDALLIGFAGFVVTMGNPFFWTFYVLASMNLKAIPLFFGLVLLVRIFGVVVPGAVMWRLTVKRANSHDIYDLFKSSLFAFAMLLAVLIIIIIFNVNVLAEAKIQTSPTISSGNITLPDGGMGSWSKSSFVVIPLSLLQIVFPGLFYSFVGVAIAEGVSRIRKKNALK
ncbi:MAG: hypothetical protein NWE95_08125 [Candidatus Bathyarchaeota archaeon]|nr:hypothetical protein [Candidatus Bathyarchaeota archaeon]